MLNTYGTPAWLRVASFIQWTEDGAAGAAMANAHSHVGEVHTVETVHATTHHLPMEARRALLVEVLTLIHVSPFRVQVCLISMSNILYFQRVTCLHDCNS